MISSKRALMISCAIMSLLGLPIAPVRGDRVTPLRELPFVAVIEKGNLIGDPFPDPARCDPPSLVVAIEGTGFASFLRQIRPVTVHQTHCIIDDPSDPNFTNGRFKIIFATGDEILGTYSGTDVATGPDTSLLDGAFTITGGTGAFAGVSGEGVLLGRASRSGRVKPGVWTGRITIP